MFGVADAGKNVFEAGAIQSIRQKLEKLHSDYANVKKVSKADYERQAWDIISQLEKLTKLNDNEIKMKQALIAKSTGGAISSSDQIDDNIAQDIASFAK